MISRFAARALFAVLVVGVTWLSLTTNPQHAEPGIKLTRAIASFLFGDPKHADKVGHFLAYFSLGVSALGGRLFLFGAPGWTVTGLIAYGVMLEGAQGLIGLRTPELADAIANGLGAVSGAALLGAAQRFATFARSARR